MSEEKKRIIAGVRGAMHAQVECITELAEIATTGDEPLDERVHKAYIACERLQRALNDVLIAAKYTEIGQA